MTDAKVGQFCLTDHNDKGFYRRAKILYIDQGTVELFLVDYGHTEYRVSLSDIVQIPPHFIESTPFQVIFLHF